MSQYPTDETYEEGQMVCPACGHTDTDSWEIGGAAEGVFDADCDSCGAPLEVSRDITVHYGAKVRKP